MDIITKNKGILGVAALFIAGMFVYNMFFKPEEVSVPGASASSIGDDLLKIRGELEAVTFSRDIFTSAGYLLLSDFGTTVPQQPTGRTNPFDIIGRD